MFERYKATESDFEAVENALNYVWKSRLNYIFKDRSRIEKAIVISFDSEKVYYWHRRNKSYIRKSIVHDFLIKDEDQRGWSALLRIPKINTLLPKALQKESVSKISGGLLTPFIKIQELDSTKINNPYTTYESYLCTIIHEFGHVYFNHSRPWCYVDKKESLELMQEALGLFYSHAQNSPQALRIPVHRNISELFAFCTEYSAAKVFWDEFRDKLDKYYQHKVEKALTLEKKKDLLNEDSFLNDPHNFAAIIGRTIIKKYQDWPEVLIKHQYL